MFELKTTQREINVLKAFCVAAAAAASPWRQRWPFRLERHGAARQSDGSECRRRPGSYKYQDREWGGRRGASNEAPPGCRDPDPAWTPPPPAETRRRCWPQAARQELHLHTWTFPGLLTCPMSIAGFRLCPTSITMVVLRFYSTNTINKYNNQRYNILYK